MTEKQKCCFCEGRGKRFCPARGAEICSVCCGSKRGTKVDCPATCSFYPFSSVQYDQVLRIENTAKTKIVDYVVRHFGKETIQKVTRKIQGKNPNNKGEALDSNLAFGMALERLLFLMPDKQGRTLADKWRASGWQGLTHDESILIEATSKSRVTLVEVQKILDHQTVECVDLLDPERGVFNATDRAMAKRVMRFSRLLTPLINLPHLVRFNMTGILIPDFIETEELIENLKFQARSARAGSGIEKIKHFLTLNYEEISQLIAERSMEHSRAMLQRLDFYDCKAVYGLVGEYAKVKSILDGHEEFKIDEGEAKEKKTLPDSVHYVWLRVGKSKAFEKKMPSFFKHSKKSEGVGVLGSVTLFNDCLEVQATSVKKFTFAKEMVPFYFGELVRLQKEAVVDLAKQMADHLGEDRGDEDAEEAVEDANKKIPQDIQNKLFKDYFQNHYKKFLNDKLPALHGLTPREAAKNPASKPLLIKLMKQHIHGIEKQKAEKGVEFSLDWVLDELGLSELK